MQSAGRLVADAHASGRPLSAIWVDLDRFGQVNESFGHPGGDEVLENLAARFRERVNGRVITSRVGGDEFVFLVPDCNRTEALRLASELAATVEEPLPVSNLILRPTASVGVAVCEAGEPPVSLLERADRAMLAAKNRGGNTVVCSGDEPVPGRLGIMLAREELAIENLLHAALENGGFCLNYQPIIRADGNVEAVEALMRCSVNGGDIPPAKFIPVAEKTGLVVRLGEWSLLQGAMYARRLQDAGCGTKVAINVSRAQLGSSKFSHALNAALICSNVRPELVELELTESLFMDISEIVQNNLKNVIASGVSLAIDDFGTGYSCLASLKDIPARKLKLDRAFVTVLPEDQRALSVVRAMTRLGHDLGMTIVAEGCEKMEQIDVLLDAGVNAIQGFFYARPMPEEAMLSWLNTRNTYE